MLVLLQELELEGERELFQAIVEHDALDVSHSTMRPVVRCRAHGVRRLECGECTRRFGPPGAFCGCGTVEAPRWRHNCPKHNPDAFCTHGVEGVPRRRSSCPTCNPQLLCGCGTVEAPRRRADCPTHRKRPKKATVAAGAPSAKRQRTLIGGNQSLPYKEARAWVHTQGCGGKGDKFKKWQALKKKLKARGEWPNNIPSTPDQHYNEGRGWLPKGGWKDWCGE